MQNQERMTRLALAALLQVARDCRERPARRTPALRFILTCLHTYRVAGDRSAYDDFWQVVTDPKPSNNSEAEGRTIRATNAQTCLNRISRQAGMELTVQLTCELAQMQMTEEERAAYRGTPTYKWAATHRR